MHKNPEHFLSLLKKSRVFLPFWLIPCSVENDDRQPPQLTAVFHAVLVLAFRVPGDLVLFVNVLFPYALFLVVHVHAVQLHVSP